MIPIKQKPSDAFIPGNSYRRDDNVLMVEVEPGMFLNEASALARGVVTIDPPQRRGAGPS